MRRVRGVASVEQTLLEAGIGVDAPIAQERPVRPMFVDPLPVNFRGHNFFAVNRSFGDNFPVRAADETLAPELYAIASSGRFMPNTIRHCDIAAIRDRMMDQWLETIQSYRQKDVRVLAYLSAEYLLGPHPHSLPTSGPIGIPATGPSLTGVMTESCLPGTDEVGWPGAS